MNYELATNYWDIKDQEAEKLDSETLNKLIDEFINLHNTCALATGFNDYIRCTPIEYNYFNGYFYLISEGGHKFYSLEHNKNVCLAIYDEYKGFSSTNGMQISGKAEIIESNTKEYEEIFKKKNISLDVLKKINHPMYLIKITPQEIIFLSAELKKMGLNTYRQKITRTTNEE